MCFLSAYIRELPEPLRLFLSKKIEDSTGGKSGLKFLLLLYSDV